MEQHNDNTIMAEFLGTYAESNARMEHLNETMRQRLEIFLGAEKKETAQDKNKAQLTPNGILNTMRALAQHRDALVDEYESIVAELSRIF